MDASEIDPRCKIARVHYRDWTILNKVYDFVSENCDYIHHGTAGGAFRSHGHNLLNQDVMVITDNNNEVADVFHIDYALLHRIAQTTVYNPVY